VGPDSRARIRCLVDEGCGSRKFWWASDSFSIRRRFPWTILMKNPKKLLLAYSQEGDLLAMGDGSWARGGGYSVTANGFFTSFYAVRGLKGCVGFELIDAATMLLPYLEGKVSNGLLCMGELEVSYSRGTDTLELVSTRESVTHDEDVADDLVAHFGEQGRAIGFTLKNASKLLLPHLNKGYVISGGAKNT